MCDTPKLSFGGEALSTVKLFVRIRHIIAEGPMITNTQPRKIYKTMVHICACTVEGAVYTKNIQTRTTWSSQRE